MLVDLLPARLRALLRERVRRRIGATLDFPKHVDWRVTEEGDLAPFDAETDARLIWAPQEGSQRAFLACTVNEVLYEGTRGPGKTDALLMCFAQHVGRGYGSDWRGIIFRRTFPELSDIIEKSKKWFARIFPTAVYNEGKHEWHWPSGEILYFRFADKLGDYDKYHGHEYPFIGWEELTTWATSELYQKMISLNRSSNPHCPRLIRATTNPYGVGHNWVKGRWQLPGPVGRPVSDVIKSFDEKGLPLPDRCSVHGRLIENKIMLHADPGYEAKIRASADNEEQIKAWLEGSWDIVAGGMFDDVWDKSIHVIDPPIPPDKIPLGWRIDRSYDDGQARPFSVGWWAQSNGEPLEWEVERDGKKFKIKVGEVPGDLLRIAEWYGWNGHENKGANLASRDIALGIIECEKLMGITERVLPGPADTAIWNATPTDRAVSVASTMRDLGVEWERADKGAGSREQGWKEIRARLKGAKPNAEGRREYPGIYVNSTCKQWCRTVPILPRDEKKPDDVDTEAEDHAGDETRYRVRRRRGVATETEHLVY